MTKQMTTAFPYIHAWNQMLGGFAYFGEAQVLLAIDEKAPDDAIYRDGDGSWRRARDLKKGQLVKLNQILSELYPSAPRVPDNISEVRDDMKFLLRRIPYDDERRIYPEVCIDIEWLKRQARGAMISFPDKCPTCGGQVAAQGEDSILYRCGGSYLPKPQIQSHTLKYWGSCQSSTINEGQLRGKFEETGKSKQEETS